MQHEFSFSDYLSFVYQSRASRCPAGGGVAEYNTYTHLGLDAAKEEMIRLEKLNQAKKEIDKTEGKKPLKQNMFRVI